MLMIFRAPLGAQPIAEFLFGHVDAVMANCGFFVTLSKKVLFWESLGNTFEAMELKN